MRSFTRKDRRVREAGQTLADALPDLVSERSLTMYYRRDGHSIPSPRSIVTGKIVSGAEALNLPGYDRVRRTDDDLVERGTGQDLIHIDRREREAFARELTHGERRLIPTNKNVGTVFRLQVADAINFDGRMSEREGENFVIGLGCRQSSTLADLKHHICIALSECCRFARSIDIGLRKVLALEQERLAAG